MLARIIAAHATAHSALPVLSAVLEQVETRALQQEAAAFRGLRLDIGSVDISLCPDRDAAVAKVGDGMRLFLQDDRGARGLLCVSHGLGDALIEVQTTGRVDETGFAPRPVTDIDRAMARDFIDLFLAAISKESEDRGGGTWPAALRFGGPVTDHSQIALRLPDDRYHCVRIALGFSGTERTAEVMHLLPVRAPDMASDSRTCGSGDPEWAGAMRARLLAARLDLDAVLCRSWITVTDMKALAPGTLLPFTPGDLDRVQIEDKHGTVLASGRLGQVAGNRAVRIGEGAVADGQSEDRPTREPVDDPVEPQVPVNRGVTSEAEGDPPVPPDVALPTTV